MIPRGVGTFSDRLAITDADIGTALSFAELRSAVISAASGFSSAFGLHKGEVVLIFTSNSLHFPVAFFAALALGAMVTIVNPLYTVPELSKQARDASPKIVITIPKLWPKATSLGLPAVIIGPKGSPLIPSPTTPIAYFTDLVSSPVSSMFSSLPVYQSDVVTLLYSSGTTGAIEGVILTHRNFIYSTPMVVMDQDTGGDRPNIFLCFLPMFHVFGLAVIVYAQLQRGNNIVSMAMFNMEATLKVIEK